ncbi:hypothetical protein, partial [Streptomyces sp. NPDC002922]|uniref:hypothetical protein n=1 Tax=Streptomyces sp. NPDC002922 TaxID=3154439 RepID=UPI0033A71B9E
MPTARHTLTVRLPLGATDDGPVATALAAASKRWWPDGPHPRLWSETLGLLPQSSIAPDGITVADLV